MVGEMAQDTPREVKRPGRPKEFDGTPVSVRLPHVLHDLLSREAIKRGVDLSDVIRERLANRLARSGDPSRPTIT